MWESQVWPRKVERQGQSPWKPCCSMGLWIAWELKKSRWKVHDLKERWQEQSITFTYFSRFPGVDQCESTPQKIALSRVTLFSCLKGRLTLLLIFALPDKLASSQFQVEYWFLSRRSWRPGSLGKWIWKCLAKAARASGSPAWWSTAEHLPPLCGLFERNEVGCVCTCWWPLCCVCSCNSAPTWTFSSYVRHPSR